MAQDKPIRFGVIGAGKIGTFHTRTLAKMKGVTLVGVCDPDVLRAQKLAWAHNCTPYTKPEELIGRKLIVVANLLPATLCGIESQGMILASGEETIRVVFLADDTPLGERVR